MEKDNPPRLSSGDAAQTRPDLQASARARQQPTEEIRASQTRVSHLQHERRQLRDESEQARALRDIATQATDPGIAGSRREQLMARFEQMRAALRDLAAGNGPQATPPDTPSEPTGPAPATPGTTDVEPPAAEPAAPVAADVEPTTPVATTPETADVEPPTPGPAPIDPGAVASAVDPVEGITISGNIRETSGENAEERVAIEESIVARERGIVGVRVDNPDQGVLFRFEDSGNGQVRATRYETRDGQQVLVDSQTLSAPGAGDSTAGGAAGPLNFDRLGLRLDLGASYTPGDLHYVEIDAGSSPQQQLQAGQTTITQIDTLTIESSSSAGDAVTALERALDQISQREQILAQALDTEATTLVPFLDSLLGQADSQTRDLAGSLLNLSNNADGRDAVLRELAATLVAQDDLSNERVLQLLA